MQEICPYFTRLESSIISIPILSNSSFNLAAILNSFPL
jgi:hypothetical protein